MKSEVISNSPEQRKTVTAHVDEIDQQIILATEQDVTALLEANKAEYAATDERARWGEWRKVASIDMVTYMQLVLSGVVDDDKAFSRWLNDSDFKSYRTRPGRV